MKQAVHGGLWALAVMMAVNCILPTVRGDDGQTNATLISTSLPIRQPNEPEFALDGKTDTYFQSARPTSDGDDFTITFPDPMPLESVEVLTGRSGENGIMEYGALEISEDGQNYSRSTGLTDGAARIACKGEKMLTIRLRATGASQGPIAIREFVIKTKNPIPPVRFYTRAEVDYSTAPECAAFARRSKAIVEEWYPRLRELLKSDPQPPRRSVIKLQFVPGEIKGFVGFTTDRGTIIISSDWILHKAVRDYGLVVHELTHVAQQYEGSGEGWLTEGIADYVRDYVFEPGQRTPNIDPKKASYRDGYLTTAAFLDWLERKKHPGIISALSAASRHRQPIIPLFHELIGKTVDDLWAEFIESKEWTHAAKTEKEREKTK